MDATLESHLRSALCNAVKRLMEERCSAGCWRGELASSALATATAAFALDLYARSSADPEAVHICDLARRGRSWLAEHQNPDGGWGDTPRSSSNISTTALCWAALENTPEAPDETLRRARRYLSAACGSLEPAALARTIAARYGHDRTFSVPILTMCALAGRLGQQPWALIPQLPFELAALPHQLFSLLRLPVVSYALPALIAMGQVRHAMHRTRNPLAAIVRDMARLPTLRVLRAIQPESGGFLEATPLTSFVVMSLIAAGWTDHPVVRRGIRFLLRSARRDGSWPIDTDLATWLTTLSINALAPMLTRSDRTVFPAGGGFDCRPVIRWLLEQQHIREHPYTHAAPGGWAWTDLDGGVPDADDTAGALLALRVLLDAYASRGDGDFRSRVLTAARMALRWLMDLQNRDGGIPTFCRGWTSLPFDRSGADLTAHALLAWRRWRDLVPRMSGRLDSARGRALRYLSSQQRPDGSFLPLWFGNERSPDDENPLYGTSRVLMALAAAAPHNPMTARAARWLLSAQNTDGGWGGSPGVPASVEETALAVHALVEWNRQESAPAIERGVRWLIEHTDCGRHFDAAPIGLYFARLWYYERLYPLIFTVGALARLCPGP